MVANGVPVGWSKLNVGAHEVGKLGSSEPGR